MNHAYDKYENGERIFDKEKALHEFNTSAYLDANGVLRWSSNDQVPPDECLDDFCEVGCVFDIELAKDTRKREDAEFFDEYRRNWSPPTGEHLAELRAEFGEGAEMVDVVAGRKFRL